MKLKPVHTKHVFPPACSWWAQLWCEHVYKTASFEILRTYEKSIFNICTGVYAERAIHKRCIKCGSEIIETDEVILTR